MTMKELSALAKEGRTVNYNGIQYKIAMLGIYYRDGVSTKIAELLDKNERSIIRVDAGKIEASEPEELG